jgi:hypothetical protein
MRPRHSWAQPSARDRSAFRHAVKVTMLWSELSALGFALAYAGGGQWTVSRLTDQPAVRGATRTRELIAGWPCRLPSSCWAR